MAQCDRLARKSGQGGRAEGAAIAIGDVAEESGEQLTYFQAGQRRHHAVQGDHCRGGSSHATKVAATLLLYPLSVAEVLLAYEGWIEHAGAVQAAASGPQDSDLPSRLDASGRGDHIYSQIDDWEQVLLR